MQDCPLEPWACPDGSGMNFEPVPIIAEAKPLTASSCSSSNLFVYFLALPSLLQPLILFHKSHTIFFKGMHMVRWIVGIAMDRQLCFYIAAQGGDHWPGGH